MATKQASKAGADDVLVLSLPPITELGGVRNTNIAGQVKRRYSDIHLVKRNKRTGASVGDPVARVQGDEIDKMSHLSRWLICVVFGAYGSSSFGPDGAVLYARDNLDTVLKAMKPGFLNNYNLVVIPSGRNGCKGYDARLGDYVDIIKAKATLLDNGIAHFGVNDRQTQEKNKDGDASLESNIRQL